MIRDLINLLNSDDFMYESDADIQFAKGAYKFPLSIKEFKERNKRIKLVKNG